MSGLRGGSCSRPESLQDLLYKGPKTLKHTALRVGFKGGFLLVGMFSGAAPDLRDGSCKGWGVLATNSSVVQIPPVGPPTLEKTTRGGRNRREAGARPARDSRHSAEPALAARAGRPGPAAQKSGVAQCGCCGLVCRAWRGRAEFRDGAAWLLQPRPAEPRRARLHPQRVSMTLSCAQSRFYQEGYYLQWW